MTERSILAKIKMIEMGLVPAFSGYELSNMLKSLSDSDRRVAKRKFRKAWKKLLKQEPELAGAFLSDQNPCKRAKKNRAIIVTTRIVSSINK